MIKVKNLIKTYGNFTALDKVNFEVEKSTIHGLLGENGAGKTTTMRCLLGLTYADSGEMYINDDLVARKNNNIRKKVSYLAGDFRPYENFTAQNYFKYILSIENNISKKYLELAERFKLDLRKKIKELSKGNKQKVGIIQAFMKDPQILILDEPTSGLDPNYQKVFRDLIFEEKSEGKTILLSSHDLLEISNCCDFVTIIRDGKVTASQSKSEIEKVINFEEKIFNTYNKGLIKYPVHLSKGNEKQLSKIFQYVGRNDWLFSSWRNHSHALLHGMSEKKLYSQIINGRSMYVSCNKRKRNKPR